MNNTLLKNDAKVIYIQTYKTTYHSDSIGVEQFRRAHGCEVGDVGAQVHDCDQRH